ncbi:unnamed protein product [Pieris brassicae]|uniref:Uncharacterized protein n=1 Tax=Pieris brassicae TaxID=7116 RepID=A0A9P0WTR0_PIEBR|nr:unnamed protein product [Pieris brassicae]
MDLTTRRENDGVNGTECRDGNGEIGSEVPTRKSSSFTIRNLVGGDDRPADGAVNASEVCFSVHYSNKTFYVK